MGQLLDERELRMLMVRICNSDSLSEAYQIFSLFSDELQGCKFVFAARQGAEPGFAINREFSAGAAVRSLFHAERVLVLDADTFRDMSSGRATYQIDYSISLDTQALSYLEPYIAGDPSGRLPKDIKEVFDFIARDDVRVDPIPYFLENLRNIDDKSAADRIFGKLKAYEILRTLDQAWLKTNSQVRSTLTEPELVKRAQEHIAGMYSDRDNSAIMKILQFRHQYMYCSLLKMACIQMRSPAISMDEKIIMYSEFCDSKLATMNGRDTAIAREYFSRGQKLKFFGKIQRNNKNIFNSLDGMAWDLWHVRQLEEAMTFKLSKNARYFFPALLTFDKRLIEVIDLYPLKACAFKDGDCEAMPFYDGNWFNLVARDEIGRARFIDKFYSEDATQSRANRRAAAKATLHETVTMLERELSEISMVSAPSHSLWT
jgi:hypothetical protein